MSFRGGSPPLDPIARSTSRLWSGRRRSALGPDCSNERRETLHLLRGTETGPWRPGPPRPIPRGCFHPGAQFHGEVRPAGSVAWGACVALPTCHPCSVRLRLPAAAGEGAPRSASMLTGAPGRTSRAVGLLRSASQYRSFCWDLAYSRAMISIPIGTNSCRR